MPEGRRACTLARTWAREGYRMGRMWLHWGLLGLLWSSAASVSLQKLLVWWDSSPEGHQRAGVDWSWGLPACLGRSSGWSDTDRLLSIFTTLNYTTLYYTILQYNTINYITLHYTSIYYHTLVLYNDGQLPFASISFETTAVLQSDQDTSVV